MRTPDEIDIDTARSAFNAHKPNNPLTAWLCSPEWAPKLELCKLSGRWRLPTQFRGLPGTHGSVWRRSGKTTYTTGQVVTGEINAYTRDHVDMFAGGIGL